MPRNRFVGIKTWLVPLLCDYKTLRLNGRQKRKCVESEERSFENKPDLMNHKMQNAN